MKNTRPFILIIFLSLLGSLMIRPAVSQETRFDYMVMEEGLDAAREENKIVLVYLYGEEGGGFEAYDAIWEHPLVDYFIEDMTVMVAINQASEEGDDFVRHLERRLRVDAGAPGIYFFSDTGRSLGNIQGPLDTAEAPGRVLMALGAADYARFDARRLRSRRS